jgi:hypothetical protein
VGRTGQAFSCDSLDAMIDAAFGKRSDGQRDGPNTPEDAPDLVPDAIPDTIPDAVDAIPDAPEAAAVESVYSSALGEGIDAVDTASASTGGNDMVQRKLEGKRPVRRRGWTRLMACFKAMD